MVVILYSATAFKVTGVDISKESIHFAKNHCESRNINFIEASATDNLFDKNEFDLICTFETIEHLTSSQRNMFLENLVKWIKKDGVILLSTPNKYVTSPFTDKPLNKFHVLEYTEISLLDELNNYFYVRKFWAKEL